MNESYYGVAYLDLSGNRIHWTSHKNHSEILLQGSDFHDVVPMTTLVISCLCGLALLFVLPSIQKYDKQTAKKPGKKTLGSAVLCMICLRSFFAFDIANRVEHERQLIVPPAYIAIDVPMGTLSSLADGILQVWLLRASPVNVQEGPSIPKYTMVTAFVIFSIISLVCKGAQIYAIVQQISPNFIHSLANGNKKTEDGLTLGFEIYQDLNTAASGMMFLFAIGFAIFAAAFVRQAFKDQPHTHNRHFHVAIGTLALLFFARNAVMFTFTLVYSQLNHIAPPGIQLVYLAFYGILSVGVYACISMAVKNPVGVDPSAHVPGLGQVELQIPEDGPAWEQEKPMANVNAAPWSNVYGSYRYEPAASI